MSVFSANYVKLWFLSLISVTFRVFKWVALKRNLFPVHKIYTIVVLRNLVKRRPNCVNLSGRKILPGVGSFWPGLHFPLGEVSGWDAPTQRFRTVFLVQLKLKKQETSVPDPDPNPDPPEPRVFWPPGSGSGSTSQRYGSGFGSGSGSFYHAKIIRKILNSTILWLFLTFYLWKIM